MTFHLATSIDEVLEHALEAPASSDETEPDSRAA
jgi:hypothetical protein